MAYQINESVATFNGTDTVSVQVGDTVKVIELREKTQMQKYENTYVGTLTGYEIDNDGTIQWFNVLTTDGDALNLRSANVVSIIKQA